jgi:hypothetical protein
VSVTEIGAGLAIPNVASDGHWWSVECPGRTVFGHKDTRPVQVITDKVCYCSIKEPIYGSGFAPSSGTAALTAATAGTGLVPATTAKVREVWRREITGERSLAGEATSDLTISTASTLVLKSNAEVPATELYITTREFYLYLETLGAYYKCGEVPYDGGDGATGIALGATGQVSSVAITAGGRLYTAAPAVTFSGGGGSGAAGTATISGGAVTGVTITDPGSGYTSDPSVAFADPTGGTQATDHTTVAAGAVTGFVMDVQGASYLQASPPAVTVAAPPLATATAHSTIAAGAVNGLVLDTGGTGYVSAATATVAAPTLTTATATATLSGGTVDSIAAAVEGSGYVTVPTVTVAAPPVVAAQFTAIANAAGEVISASVTNAGWGYASNPTGYVVYNYTTQAVAAASANSLGRISAVGIPEAGWGYSSATVTIAAPASGTGAAATATATCSGHEITGIVVTYPGRGYASGEQPTITISAPNETFVDAEIEFTAAAGVLTGAYSITVAGTGMRLEGVAMPGNIATPTADTATATVTVVAGKIGVFTVTNAGSFYIAAPAVTISAPAGYSTATATVTVAAGAISGINLVDGGGGYTEAPAVTISDPAGYSTATGTATVSAGGAVTGIVLGSGGCGYAAAPAVSIGIPGTTATGTVARGTGVITSVTVTAGGGSYTSAPAVILSGGSPTTVAKAHAVLTGSAVTSVVIDDGGSGYTTAPTVVFGGVLVSMTAETLRNQRPLEDYNQTSVFPAVDTAAFYRLRLFGAKLTGREPTAGASMTLTRASNLCTISGDTWREADVQRGIVDRRTNEIIAYVDRIISTSVARVTFPFTTDITTWPNETETFYDWALTGDDTMIYTTPIYLGEAGGGITYGMVTWNPLDQLKDNTFYATGAKICCLARQTEDLLVIYDRGVAVYTGSVSVGAPPALSSYISAENLGSLQPNTVWTDNAGALWFYGNGRLYRVQSGTVQSVSASMGVARMWDQFVYAGTGTQQAAYNPGRNATLIVGMRKKTDASTELYKYGFYVDHSQGSITPVRFPIAVKCAKCVQYDNGTFVWYAGADDRLYKLLVADTYTDTYYTGATLTSGASVTWYYKSGVDWYDATAWLRGIRHTIESDDTALTMTFEVEGKQSNIVGSTFTADATHSLSYETLTDVEEVRPYNVGGRALQYKWSGTASAKFDLLDATLRIDILQPPWRGQPHPEI